jgi:hypothetical protein
MNNEALIEINDIKNYIIKKYSLKEKIRTKNNLIYRNDKIVLIENIFTGDLKVKRNLRSGNDI